MLCSEPHWTEKIIKETLHIRASAHYMNLDSGMTIDSGPLLSVLVQLKNV